MCDRSPAVIAALSMGVSAGEDNADLGQSLNNAGFEGLQRIFYIRSPVLPARHVKRKREPKRGSGQQETSASQSGTERASVRRKGE